MNDQKTRFLGLKENPKGCSWQLLGLPYDGTSSYRKGSRWGPAEIRIASDSIETYCPVCRRDLEDLHLYDAGDLDVMEMNPDAAVQKIADYYKEQYQAGQRIFGIGGEHTITIGAVRGMIDAGNKPYVLYLDAHLDQRDEYLGEKNSHACVARRLQEMVGTDRLLQWGMRSGEKCEFQLVEVKRTFYGADRDSLSVACTSLRDKQVYLSLDLDLFAPSLIPGVGNPEPGGPNYDSFLKLLPEIAALDIIGADVVELSPVWDTTGRSSVIAAEIIRELLLTIIH
jgi:agmatinase